jgi:glycerol uptake facilitator-like aquaporin
MYVAKWWQKLVGEFVASALFLFAVSASVVIPTSQLSAGPALTSLIAALVQGLSLVAVVASFSWISGSYVNVAVTITAAAANKISPAVAAGYVVAQLSGSVVGAAVARGAFPGWRAAHLSAPAVGGGVSLFQAYLIETVLTLLLLLVVLGTSTDTRQGLYILAPIPIGFTLTVAVLVARTLTGASLSPNRALATTLVGEAPWVGHWIYWVAPATAVILATVLYHTIFNVRVAQQENLVLNGVEAGTIV